MNPSDVFSLLPTIIFGTHNVMQQTKSHVGAVQNKGREISDGDSGHKHC